MNNPFERQRERLVRLRDQRRPPRREPAGQAKEEPSPFVVCKACGATVTRRALADNAHVCPACGAHHRISAAFRLKLILDPGTFSELNRSVSSADPLSFPGYREKLEQTRQRTRLTEAALTGTGEIGGRKVAVGVLDPGFFMGSMSAAVGEKITRLTEYAEKKRLPLIIFSASGGARMQEGIHSLMQMAKTSAAVERFQRSGGLFISCLTHPTTGGVSASFASLGDITLAEPGALIGFAGPRVIEQTIRQKLPEGFQRAEYLEEHGFVDRIVPRGELRDTLILLLRLHERGRRRT